jgi:hypothetical protein
MLTTLISFLTGSVFRMIWGEASAWLTKMQDHSQEIERMRLQGELDAQQHARNLEAQKLQAHLGVQVIRVQGEEDIGRVEADGWLEAVKATGRAIGVAWVDAWNAAIRPGVATWAIVMLTCAEFHLITQLSENTASVCAAALGIYLADRSLMKRGK